MTTNFRVHVVTWNVAEQPPPEDFTQLLSLDADVLPNIYAIGLQELKATTQSMFSDAFYDDAWSLALMNCLCSRKYVRVKSVRMIGLHLVVYVRRTDLLYLKNVESEYTRTGFNGLWGNKGGVSVRMDISGINVCFVNCHLAAHLDNVPDRIADYNQILEGQKFRDEDTDYILDHDYIFWFGDLNFRIDDVPKKEVLNRIAERDYDFLLRYDQLLNAMRDEAILVDFEEGPITFPPSYKFDMDTDIYDTSKKQRKPAWCDRVLWQVHERWFEGILLGVEQKSYTSLPHYTLSDHKPVIAVFDIRVLKIPPELPVMFEPQDRWCVTESARCTYSVGPDLTVSAWDWIGLYKHDFKHIKDYVTYVWVDTKGDDMLDGTKLYTVEIDRLYLKDLDPGSYMLGYFSNEKNCLMGYSDTLTLSLVEESSSDSSDVELSSSSSDDMTETRSLDRKKLL